MCSEGNRLTIAMFWWTVGIRDVIKNYQEWFYLSKNTKLSFKIVHYRCNTIPPALLQLLEATLVIIFSQRLKSICHILFYNFLIFK